MLTFVIEPKKYNLILFTMYGDHELSAGPESLQTSVPSTTEMPF